MLLKIFLVLLLFFPLSACQAAEITHGRVTRVYDGDTIEVEPFGRVRLLGIDCPEHQASDRDHYYQRRFRTPAETLRRVARQATDFVIEKGLNQRVRLEFDRERTDQYGRTLAYVYLTDGRLLNLMLIEEGLAAVYRRAEFMLKDQFVAAEDRARKRHVGMWQKPDQGGK